MSALVILALLAVYLVWGSTYLMMRIAIETLPPFLMGGVRFLLAGGILYAVMRWRGAPAPTPTEWTGSARVGVLLFVAGNGFVAVAEQWVSSSLAAVVVATMPLWMALLGTFRGERPSRAEWTGLLIGFLGVGLLQIGGELHAAHAGALIILLAPLGWAVGSLWTRSLPLPAGPMASATQMITGGVAMLAVGLIMGERIPPAPSGRSLAALAYLVIFGSILAFSAYGYLLRNTRPALATSYAYVNPIVAIVLGMVFGGEKVGAVTWAAATVVLVGVVVLTRARSRAVASPSPRA